ncbi:hypothetical protein GCM10010168_65820 [Actinoplanes ianthinogenes]|uniref:Secreted protein n=1 Tax=Actinoplanes ianthinogenes TaxID=122358 RepID=A0ABN6CCJ9_9ACTN|nr:hypothetical protein [Actinoplanes ianthinogenes]BCJ42042.1 hypothetical protein Aiant_26990 [Actinoplanes ianthinogenes]GGR38038.1 hypothetical protein GCM10010168_65820 [Actinoplanes ianthinogenes]
MSAVILLALAGTLVNAGPAAAVPRLLAHVCKEIGSFAGYTGVHCADLYREGSQVWGGNEIICQLTGDQHQVVACAGIKEQPTLQVNSTTYRGTAGTCGAAYGHSPCRAERIINYTQRVTACDAIVYGGTVKTTILLPGATQPIGGTYTQLFTDEYGIRC